MPRKAIGERPMTQAERQAQQRAKRAWQHEQLVEALSSIVAADYVTEARQIAEDALRRITRPSTPRGA
jgi:fructose-1,6-bisphosphatase/inositol monophosphatase family enzyme